HRVGDRRDETRGYLGAIHLGEVALNLPYGHAAGVERNNLVVKARPAGLVFADELGLEDALAVARDVQRQLAKLPLECLRAMPVAGVASDIGHRIALVVTEMF